MNVSITFISFIHYGMDTRLFSTIQEIVNFSKQHHCMHD